MAWLGCGQAPHAELCSALPCVWPAWDHDGIDHWKEVEYTEEMAKGNTLVEETSFCTLFPKYRELYLREWWPKVTQELKKHASLTFPATDRCVRHRQPSAHANARPASVACGLRAGPHPRNHDREDHPQDLGPLHHPQGQAARDLGRPRVINAYQHYPQYRIL